MIEHTNNETTTSNQRNANQSANHSPSPLDSNSIPTTRQHAINSTTRQHLIRATAKEPQNPQNHNKPSQTNKMNKLKTRQRQLHFTGASAQTTIKQLTTQPHTDKIPKNNPAPPRQTPPREAIPRGQDSNVLPRRNVPGSTHCLVDTEHSRGERTIGPPITSRGSVAELH